MFKKWKKKKHPEQKMRVSFDLDEVLFVSPETYKVEPALRFPFNKRYKERLRLGTVELIHELQRQNIEVWVYTSSFRSVDYIRNLFAHYHVKFDDIVNGQRHMKEVQGTRGYAVPNKLPSKYRIALHIDDEIGIYESGKLHGFKVMRVYEPDDRWAEKILARALEIKKREYGGNHDGNSEK